MKKNIECGLKLFVFVALLNIGIFAQRNLTQGSWSLAELNGRLIENSKASIAFYSDNRITGNGGCNEMFGKFTVNRTSIGFSGIGTTKMLCGLPGVVKTEAEFTRALDKATRYSVRGDALKIYAGRKLIMRLDREYPTVSAMNYDDPDLEDMKWVLDPGDRKSTTGPDGPFVVFNKQKGSAGGNTGCNVFGSTYVTQGEKIAVTEIISTMRACVEDNRMNTEKEFLDGLGKADRYKIEQGKLYFYSGKKLLLTFSGRDKDK